MLLRTLDHRWPAMVDDDLKDLVREVATRVTDRRVLAAMRAVSRADFVPKPMRDYAFDDRALPIGHGQTISQPAIVAIMTEALQMSGSEHVLEIGTGSGYQTAILAKLAAAVVSVEVVPELREQAPALLTKLGFHNVIVLAPGDQLGAPERGPYDRIIVTAACPAIPPSLVGQLTEGGLLIAPVGSRTAQDLVLAKKTPDGLQQRTLGGCHFVPLVGPEGFVLGPPD